MYDTFISDKETKEIIESDLIKKIDQIDLLNIQAIINILR
jgi:hypothetical protein